MMPLINYFIISFPVTVKFDYKSMQFNFLNLVKFSGTSYSLPISSRNLGHHINMYPRSPYSKDGQNLLFISNIDN